MSSVADSPVGRQSELRKIIGIDLGAIYSCAGHINAGGHFEPFVNSWKSVLTPSDVWIEGENELWVGEAAIETAKSGDLRGNLISMFKREMGRPVQWGFGDRQRRPEEVSAIIIKKLKQDAERCLQREIQEAVVTVPACSGWVRRHAIRDAAEMAGLIVPWVMDAPAAVAIAASYGNPDFDGMTLVVHLGAEALDLAMFRMSPEPHNRFLPNIRMISSGGNIRLGAIDWDQRIQDFVAEEFLRIHPSVDGHEMSDPRNDPSCSQRLLHECQRARVHLVKHDRVRLVCSHLGYLEKIDLDRRKLDELTADLLGLVGIEIDHFLEVICHSEASIDRLICAGSGCEMGAVGGMLETRFPGRLTMSRDVDYSVLNGAALWGGLLSSGAQGEIDALSMVAPHALGIGVACGGQGDHVRPVVVKNRRLPCEVVERIPPGVDRLSLFENDARKEDEILEAAISDPTADVLWTPTEDVEREIAFRLDGSNCLSIAGPGLSNTGEDASILSIREGMDNSRKTATREWLRHIVIKG